MMQRHLLAFLLLSAAPGCLAAGMLTPYTVDLRKPQATFAVTTTENSTPELRFYIRENGAPVANVTNWTAVYWYGSGWTASTGWSATNTAIGADYFDFRLPSVATAGTYRAQLIVYGGSLTQEWKRGSMTIQRGGALRAGVTAAGPTWTNLASVAGDAYANRVRGIERGTSTATGGLTRTTSASGITYRVAFPIPGAATNAPTIAQWQGSNATLQAGIASRLLTATWQGTPAYRISVTDTSHWHTAYGWGNHAAAGYLTDAPSNGTQYARQNGAWAAVTGGGGGEPLWTAVSNTVRTQAAGALQRSGGTMTGNVAGGGHSLTNFADAYLTEFLTVGNQTGWGGQTVFVNGTLKSTGAMFTDWTAAADNQVPNYRVVTNLIHTLGTGGGEPLWNAVSNAVRQHASTNYLPLAGGNLTGNLSVQNYLLLRKSAAGEAYISASNSDLYLCQRPDAVEEFRLDRALLDIGMHHMTAYLSTNNGVWNVVNGTTNTIMSVTKSGVSVPYGAISGNGSGITAINASALASGTVPIARLPTRTNSWDVGYITAANTNVQWFAAPMDLATLALVRHQARVGSGTLQLVRGSRTGAWNAYTNLGAALSMTTTAATYTPTSQTVNTSERIGAKWTARAFTNGFFSIRYTIQR